MQGPWKPHASGHLVFLIRHGRTAWNAQRRFLGRTDVPLDDVGLAEAARLAFLGAQVHRVVASPLSRARQTAEALGLPVEIDGGLVELNQGELEGMEGPEAFRRFPEFFAAWASDPTEVVVPGGESLAAVRRRALDALERLGSPAPVALVSHQMVIASVRATVADDGLGNWRHYGVPNGSVTVLERTGAKWVERVGGWLPPEPEAR